MKILIRSAALIGLLAVTTLAQAQGRRGGPPAAPPSLINYEQAAAAIDAAEAVARENGWLLTILVVDQNNNPVMMRRLDGAAPFTWTIVQRKALTVIESGLTSGQYGERVQAGEIEQAEGTVTFAGGVPIYIDGTLVGAITASGAAAEEDEVAAMAGVEAIGGSISAN